MKRIITTLAALAVSASFTFAAEDAAKKPEAKGEGKKPDPEKVFGKKDKDGDGNLTKEEFTAGAKDATKAEAAFGKKDANADGKLSKEEFAAQPAKKKKD
jgi:Ca2+-binding EF-hand superfamily protein